MPTLLNYKSSTTHHGGGFAFNDLCSHCYLALGLRPAALWLVWLEACFKAEDSRAVLVA